MSRMKYFTIRGLLPIHEITKTFARRSIFTYLSEEELCKPKIQCRNRPYLAGGTSKLFPDYLPQETNKYFCGIRFDKEHTSSNLTQIGEHFKDFVDNNITAYSAFLIKGLPIKDARDFQTFVAGLNYTPVNYDAGNAFRENVEELLYTASDEPPEVSIEPHNEMSYLKNFCSKIMFCCLSAADEGGDSPLVFNRDLTQGLSKSLIEKVKKRRIRYIRNLSCERNSTYFTWQEVFKTKSIEEAEKKMIRENMEWKWLPNENLRAWGMGDATINHPITGEEIWFNQLAAAHSTYYKTMPMHKDEQDLDPNEYSLNTSYGDGEAFEEEVLDEIRFNTWNNAMSLKLQPRDVLLLDNYLCQHSRMSYYGGERKMVVSLAW